MKFGKSADEAANEPGRGGGSSDFMKYMKDGDNYFHIMDEPDKWIYYWEHYNPDGYSFPCTNDRSTCPGCTSDNEKMSKASRKIAFNAYDGEYTNVWKVPKSVADKLKNRYERLGTVTDRPYIVTRLKDGNSYDFDVEGQEKTKLPSQCAEHWVDPEEMLAKAYEDAWGDSAKTTSSKVQSSKEQEVRSKIDSAKEDKPAWADTPAPFEGESEEEEEVSVAEGELRAMNAEQLRELCEKEGFGKPPARLKKPDSIVDWMLDQ